MPQSPLIRFTLAALGGALVACAVLWGLVLVNAGTGFSRCTATTGFGWSVPILAGIVTAGVALVLLKYQPDDDLGSRGMESSDGLACPACGGGVRSSWRLCPHCGELLGSDEIEQRDI